MRVESVAVDFHFLRGTGTPARALSPTQPGEGAPRFRGAVLQNPIAHPRRHRFGVHRFGVTAAVPPSKTAR